MIFSSEINEFFADDSFAITALDTITNRGFCTVEDLRSLSESRRLHGKQRRFIYLLSRVCCKQRVDADLLFMGLYHRLPV